MQSRLKYHLLSKNVPKQTIQIPSMSEAYFQAIYTKKPFPSDKALDDFFRSRKIYPVQNTKEIFDIKPNFSKFWQDIIWSGLLVLFAFWALFYLLCYALVDLTDLF